MGPELDFDYLVAKNNVVFKLYSDSVFIGGLTAK